MATAAAPGTGTQGVKPVIRRTDMIVAGYSDREIQGFVRQGDLVRLRPGYFAARDQAGVRDEDLHRLRALAAADAGTRLVVSHVSAAVFHGLRLHAVDLATVHLTRPGRGGGRGRPGQQVHTGRLLPTDIVTVDGCQVTSPARTAVDLARSLPFASAVVTVDAVLQDLACEPTEIARSLAAVATVRGHGAAHRAVAAADGRSESVGETLTRLMLVQAGLPAPELQPSIYDERGNFVGRPDLAYLESGVLIEFDGKIKYQRELVGDSDVTEVVLREKRREERLAELGWLTIRVTWSDLANPAALMARVRRAITARRRLVEAGGIRGHVIKRPTHRVAPC